MPKSSASDQGFTLLELLIVISIIVIVTASVIPSFAGYIRNQGIKQAQESLKSDLRNIQNKALTGALSDITVGGNPAAFWGIRFSPGGGTGTNRYEYFITDVDSSCPSGDIPAGQLQGYTDIADGIEVRTSDYQCIYFSFANGGISTVDISGNTLVVAYSGGTADGDCRSIGFNANGLIYSTTSITCP